MKKLFKICILAPVLYLIKVPISIILLLASIPHYLLRIEPEVKRGIINDWIAEMKSFKYFFDLKIY